MWVVGTAVMHSGEVSGEGSNGAVMKRERENKKEPAIYRLLDFILILYLQFQIYILERLFVVHGELCGGNMSV